MRKKTRRRMIKILRSQMRRTKRKSYQLRSKKKKLKERNKSRKTLKMLKLPRSKLINL